MVFTEQGGISKRAEAKGRTEKDIFDEMVESISRCLAKFSARATLRRSGKHQAATPAEKASTAALWDAVLQADPVADGE
jgi:hypothetical protein